MHNNWRSGGTRLGWTWMWLGNRAQLWLHFVLPMSIEDRLLHWTPIRSQTYYPEHVLTYGSGKTCYSLVMGSGSFRTDCYGGLLGRRSKHHTEAGPAVLGA
jgi:hypothetical protein